MLSQLRYLWPDFSLLFSANTNGLTAWFWLVMAAIFFISLTLLSLHFSHFRTRVRALEGLLAGQSKENLALARREILQKAETLGNSSHNIGKLWREFDESLVMSGDQKLLFNTLDAEHFFNARTLATGLTASRLLSATPGFLVAIGVLGTFVGLTIGLESLEVGSSSNADTLRQGIDGLISGAAVAFSTSVWGVTFSLLLNFIEKLFERRALAQIRQLQQTVDYLYPRIPAEQSLVHIADHSRESSQALQELHERIGNRLQETVQGMSEAMQTALADVMNDIMKPAIQTLVSNASQQSSRALEQLVGNFMEGIHTAGRQQGDLMETAAASVNAAVDNMARRMDQMFNSFAERQELQQKAASAQSSQFDAQLERLASMSGEQQQQLADRFTTLLDDMSRATEAQLQALTTSDSERQKRLEELLERQSESFAGQINTHAAAIREQEQKRAALEEEAELRQTAFLEKTSATISALQAQGKLMAQQHQDLLSKLQSVAQATAESSGHMSSSATQLQGLSTNVRQAAETLGTRMESITQRIESTDRQSADIASRLARQTELLAELQRSLLDATDALGQAASDAQGGFDNMRAHQREFLAGVREEFTKLSESLCTQVEAIEEQAQNWLTAYMHNVNQQVSERMSEWNNQTRQFSDQMLRVTQGMSNILDELEPR